MPLVLVSLDRLRVDIAALLMAEILGIAQYFGMGILGAAHTSGDAHQSHFGSGLPRHSDAVEFVYDHPRIGQVGCDLLDRPLPAKNWRSKDVLDQSWQIAARFDKVSFRHKFPGLHFTDHIHELHRRLAGCPRTGVKDELGPHKVIIRGARFLGLDFFHTPLSFSPQLIDLFFHFRQTRVLFRKFIEMC